MLKFSRFVNESPFIPTLVFFQHASFSLSIAFWHSSRVIYFPAPGLFQTTFLRSSGSFQQRLVFRSQDLGTRCAIAIGVFLISDLFMVRVGNIMYFKLYIIITSKYKVHFNLRRQKNHEYTQGWHHGYETCVVALNPILRNTAATWFKTLLSPS